MSISHIQICYQLLQTHPPTHPHTHPPIHPSTHPPIHPQPLCLSGDDSWNRSQKNPPFLSKMCNFRTLVNWNYVWWIHPTPINFSDGYCCHNVLLLVSIVCFGVLCLSSGFDEGLFLSLPPLPLPLPLSLSLSLSPATTHTIPHSHIYAAQPQGGASLTLSSTHIYLHTYISPYISLNPCELCKFFGRVLWIAPGGWVNRQRSAAPVPWAGTGAQPRALPLVVCFDESERRNSRLCYL